MDRGPSAPGISPTAWDEAHAIALDAWPGPDEDRARAGFATEIGKVAKRSGLPAAKLTRVAVVVLRLHGVATIGALSNPARAALMARLAALAHVAENARAIEVRWEALTDHDARWPTDLGNRVQRLIDRWASGPEIRNNPAVSSAASRQSDRVRNLAERVEASHRARPIPALPGGAA
jgi:hypothetical protein